MSERRKCFFDMEFTELSQRALPISIGIITENKRTFYAEFTGYNPADLTKWIVENVVPTLTLRHMRPGTFTVHDGWRARGSAEFINTCLQAWLMAISPEPDSIEFWSDCLAYDWMLLNELWGGALNPPQNVYYIPFDICTLMKQKGVDPDVNREFYSYMPEKDNRKHNALWDAEVIRACYERLTGEKL